MAAGSGQYPEGNGESLSRCSVGARLMTRKISVLGKYNQDSKTVPGKSDFQSYLVNTPSCIGQHLHTFVTRKTLPEYGHEGEERPKEEQQNGKRIITTLVTSAGEGSLKQETNGAKL